MSWYRIGVWIPAKYIWIPWWLSPPANPGVSEIPIEGELFLHRPIGATASLGGVQMHFIAILSFFHSSPVFFLEKDYRSSI